MSKTISLSQDEADLLSVEGVPALEARLNNSLTQLAGRAKAIQSKAVAERRDLTPQESSQFEKITAQFDEADYKLRALSDFSLELDGVPVKPREGAPAPIRNHNPPGGFMQQTVPYNGGARTFDALFAKRPAPPGGQFSSFGEFALTALNDGEGVSAGFLVPTQFISALLDRSLEQEIVRPRATTLPFDTNSGSIPSFNYQDGTGGLRAGLELRWVAELGTNTPQKALTRNINMRILKGAIYCNASAELTEDAPRFAARLEVAMRDAISVGLDHAWLFGSGAGVPLGVINSAGTITVAKETSQTADTVVEDNIIKMASRLAPNSWRNAVWMASPTALGQLYKLSQATGPNAGARTVTLRETDAGLTLMTKPLLITDACAPLGDLGDLVLADWSRYLIGLRKEASLETSIHAGWLNDEVGFRVILRMSGLPEMEAPTKLRDGTNTVSHFVTLAERA